MEDGIELGLEGVNKVVDKYYDNVYDKASKHNPLSSRRKARNRGEGSKDSTDAGAGAEDDGQDDGQEEQKSSRRGVERETGGRGAAERPRTVELPTPEPDEHEHQRDYDLGYNTHHRRNDVREPYTSRSAVPPPPSSLSHHSRRDDYYDRDFERQSQTSERVLRDYENERDDPRRRPDPSLISSSRSKGSRSRHYRNDDDEMSNGYGYDRRPSSQQPPRSRHDDDEDYDDHTGRVYRKTSRGYDDGYDREIIETEHYRGPARDHQRSPSYQDNDYQVAAYQRSGDVAGYEDKHRSRSRGRHDRDDYYGDERGGGHHRHRDDRSNSRERESIKDKLEDTFDKTPRGLGVGLAGAVLGSLAAKQFGDRKNNKRDMVIGALVGGLGANAAEQKYRDWSDEKKERRDDRLSVPGDNYRSRSSNR